MMRNLILALALSLLLASPAAMAQPAAPDGTPAGLQRFVDAFHPGWNLGNTFDATGDETSWGNPTTTKELIDEIAASGFKSIRIPITWRHRMGGAPDYTVRPQFMARIKEVVGWAMEADLYVMINLHHDSDWVKRMPEERQQVQARYDALWTQIAREFRDYPLTVVFEAINEPKFSDDWGKDSPEYFQLLDALNTSCHKIVRASGGNNSARPLVLSTVAAAHPQNRMDELLKTMQKLNDPNLIATFHYYGYWPFSVNIAGHTTFDDKAREDLQGAFDRAHTTFVSRGIPVIVGEFGLLGFDKNVNVIQHGETLKFFEYISHYAQQKQIPLMLWDNGQHFDRREMLWRDPLLLSVIIEGVKGRSSTAASDTIWLRKDEAAKDVQVALNLNGNTLERVLLDDEELSRDNDYSVSDGQLTLKANLLKRFAEGELETKATLMCDFSAGADWPLNIIHFDRPVLEAADGSAELFSIPTEFNADQLATMEAVYATGGNAGPQDWTPFKEFDVAFKPLYDTAEIQLTPRFFKAAKDGQIRLTFHFWSGEKLQYLITKEGDAVSGTPE